MALVHQGVAVETFRFCDAAARAQRWARALAEHRVGFGDRVAIFFPNGPDFIGAFFGAQWLGATAIPVACDVARGGPASEREAAPRDVLREGGLCACACAGSRMARRVGSCS